MELIFSLCLSISLPFIGYLLLSKELKYLENKVSKLKKVSNELATQNKAIEDSNKAQQDYLIAYLTELSQSIKVLEDLIIKHNQDLIEDAKLVQALKVAYQFYALKIDCLTCDFYKHTEKYYHLDTDKIPIKVNDSFKTAMDIERLEKDCRERAKELGFKEISQPLPERPEGL